MLVRFDKLNIFKVGSNWAEIPFFGRRLRPLLCRLGGLKFFEELMILRVGKAGYSGHTRFEIWRGKRFGWMWMIGGIKKQQADLVEKLGSRLVINVPPTGVLETVDVTVR